MDKKIFRVEMVIRPEQLDDLKDALNAIGVTGMTVYDILGCGTQLGHKLYYRGVERNITLLPKVKIEVVVSEVPVETVIEAAEKTLKTGKIGDGKIFVYDITNVVRIRTGERNWEALQNND